MNPKKAFPAILLVLSIILSAQASVPLLVPQDEGIATVSDATTTPTPQPATTTSSDPVLATLTDPGVATTTEPVVAPGVTVSQVHPNYSVISQYAGNLRHERHQVSNVQVWRGFETERATPSRATEAC